MRKSNLFAVGMSLALVFVLFADAAEAQRGRRGGGGAAAALDEGTILEEFDTMVELIWTDEEEDEWKDIDDDAVEEKQAFITAFWERRDPTPGTEDNEFRQVWMDRITYANRTFRGEGQDGWRTDRGKFYLIYGPEVIVAQENKQVAGSANQGVSAEQQAGTRMMIIWSLDPTQNPFLDDKDEISFGQFQRSYSRISGGFDYNEEAFLAGNAVKTYFEARRANPGAAGPVAATPAAAAGAPGGGGGAATPDMQAMQELMQTGTTRQDLTLTQGMGFIPAAGGNTFAIFNFEVGKEGLTFENAGAEGPAQMLAFGVLFKKDPAAADGEQFLRDVKINFAVDPSNGDAEETSTHSFGMTLEPGDYRLAWGVMDNASERIATTSYEFTAPNYTAGELAIPSVIVANGLEEKTDAIDVNTVYEGSRVGNLELWTDLDAVFGREDTLLVLYFIQGLQLDPATQQPTFEVDHRILLAGTDTSIARLQSQTLQFGAIQQEIPLGQVEQLEAGQDYEIEIHIKDQLSGTELTHKVPFTVRGG